MVSSCIFIRLLIPLSHSPLVNLAPNPVRRLPHNHLFNHRRSQAAFRVLSHHQTPLRHLDSHLDSQRANPHTYHLISPPRNRQKLRPHNQVHNLHSSLRDSHRVFQVHSHLGSQLDSLQDSPHADPPVNRRESRLDNPVDSRPDIHLDNPRNSHPDILPDNRQDTLPGSPQHNQSCGQVHSRQDSPCPAPLDSPLNSHPNNPLDSHLDVQAGYLRYSRQRSRLSGRAIYRQLSQRDSPSVDRPDIRQDNLQGSLRGSHIVDLQDSLLDSQQDSPPDSRFGSLLHSLQDSRRADLLGNLHDSQVDNPQKSPRHSRLGLHRSSLQLRRQKLHHHNLLVNRQNSRQQNRHLSPPWNQVINQLYIHLLRHPGNRRHSHLIGKKLLSPLFTFLVSPNVFAKYKLLVFFF